MQEKIEKIGNRAWHPVEVARVNDQVVRLALFKGEYHWHKHEKEDELFYVLEGEVTIQMRSRPDLVLKKGEMAVVPKGVEHCPKSSGAYILMFEPFVLESQGE